MIFNHFSKKLCKVLNQTDSNSERETDEANEARYYQRNTVSVVIYIVLPVARALNGTETARFLNHKNNANKS